MIRNILSLIFFIFYESAHWVTVLILICLSPFSRQLRKQWDFQRIHLRPTLNAIEEVKKQKPLTAVFYCSSAGEYEQALPLIEMLRQKNYLVWVFFLSKSGFDFARARNEHQFVSLAPFDSFLLWKSLLYLLKPKLSFVVRHEIWPAFSFLASRTGPLYLINSSQHQGSRTPKFFKWFQTFFITQVFSCESFGDTKYDRVLQRHVENASKADELTCFLKSKISDRRSIFIIGSAWKADIEIFCASLERLSPDEKAQIFTVIAPHDVSTANLGVIEKQLSELGHPFATIAELESNKGSSLSNIVIVDTMGRLAEFYGVADFCLVGGAMHYRVHNTLEPAAYNLPIAFGPKYHSQHEARLMVEKKIATVVETPAQLADWISLQLSNKRPQPKTRNFVESLSGASSRIFHAIENNGGANI